MLQPDTTVQGATQEPATTQTPAAVTEPTLKELNDRFLQMEADHKRATAELEERKKEISGLNRKISEDEKVIKQKELEKLSEQDRAKAELEMIRQEKLKTENEIKEMARGRVIDKALIDAGIPLEFAKRISGQEESEIQADVKAFKDYIDKLVNEKKEQAVNQALAGKAPQAGVPGTVSLQAMYDEQKKIGNLPQQMAIKRQAQREGIVLNE